MGRRGGVFLFWQLTQFRVLQKRCTHSPLLLTTNFSSICTDLCSFHKTLLQKAMASSFLACVLLAATLPPTIFADGRTRFSVTSISSIAPWCYGMIIAVVVNHTRKHAHKNVKSASERSLTTNCGCDRKSK